MYNENVQNFNIEIFKSAIADPVQKNDRYYELKKETFAFYTLV